MAQRANGYICARGIELLVAFETWLAEKAYIHDRVDVLGLRLVLRVARRLL